MDKAVAGVSDIGFYILVKYIYTDMTVTMAMMASATFHRSGHIHKFDGGATFLLTIVPLIIYST